MDTLNKSFQFACLILILILLASPGALAASPKVVQGTIIDIFNDEEAGEAYVTIKSADRLFIIDCKHKGFDTPIAPGDFVKVTVNHIRTMMNKPVGDLVSVLQHTPARR